MRFLSPKLFVPIIVKGTRYCTSEASTDCGIQWFRKLFQ